MKNNHVTLLTTTNRYLTINYLLAGIIICIFLYSGFFYPHYHNYSLPSAYTQNTGDTSPSTGLTRSFLLILKGKTQEAKNMNQHGPRLFLFFVIQFFMRIFISALLLKSIIKPSVILITDIVISATWFIIAFYPLLLFWFRIVQKILRG